MNIYLHSDFLFLMFFVFFRSGKTEDTILSCPTNIATNLKGAPGIPGYPGRKGEVGLGQKGDKGKKGEADDNTKYAIEMLKKDLDILNEAVKQSHERLVYLMHTLRKNEESFCTVGVKDGRIPDIAMSASSYYAEGYQAAHGRLDNTGEPNGFWHSKTNLSEWIQVDVGSPTRVVGVITQGRPNHDFWVTSYKMLYGNLTSNFVTIQITENNGSDMVFQGNYDRNSKVLNYFPHPITARYFRLVVVGYQAWPAIRLEYLTC